MEINSIPGPDRSIKKADLEKFRLFAKQDRNRRIGEFLKELELAEARNTGYPAILRAIERNGSPKPIIETNTSRDYFTFVLPVHKYFLQSDAETMRELNATDDPITVPVTVPVPHQYRTSTVPVTDPVKKLLAALRDGPCSPSDLRIAVGIKHRQTFRANYLNPALRNGFICAKDGLSPHDPNIRYSLTDLGLQMVMKEIKGDKDSEDTIDDAGPASGVREDKPVDEGINDRVDGGVNDGVKGRDVVVNVVANVAVNLTPQEENAVKCLWRDSKITAAACETAGGVFTAGPANYLLP